MKSSRLNNLLAILLLLVSSQSSSDQQRISLTVKVNGATPGKGQAILSLFASSADYLKQAAISNIKPVDNNGQVVFRLEHLDAGTYALSIVYDEDSNGRLNTGFLGIPTELDRLFILRMNGPLVGFSNNAKGLFGPPAYEKASFTLSAPTTMNIMLGKAKE
jgi:uncharacterized protein (DUF2141 family)